MPSGPRFARTVAVAILFALAAFGQQTRITRRIDAAQRFTLRGQVHPRATAANDIGRVPGSLEIPYVTLQFAMTDSQKADLTNLLAAQQNPQSPLYHQWLTPAQYADRFGVSQTDLNQMTDWLQNQGLTIAGIAQGRDWVAVKGNASVIEKAFTTELHYYAVDGTTHFANASDPSVPGALSGVVLSIRGLHDFKLKPANVTAKYTKQPSGNHYLAPDDFAVQYNIAPAYRAGIDGTGQTIVVGGQTNIDVSVAAHFRASWNLPVNPVQTLLVPNSQDPGTSTGDLGEADLDVEWAGAIARNATVLYVYSNDVITSVQYAIDHRLGTVVSLSYGECEPANPTSELQLLQSYAQKANAFGMTWVNASGDNGAADCSEDQYAPQTAQAKLAVDAPASVPEVTGVGGTRLQENGAALWLATNDANGSSLLGYIGEIAWNDPADSSGTPASTGGGISAYYSHPSWQTGNGVPADNYRHVPDVAMASSADHDGFLVYTPNSQSCSTPTVFCVFGGTSAPTPAFAGIVALLNQYLLTNGIQRTSGVGNINPKLYSLAQSAPSIFHDVTSGDNIVYPVVCNSRGRSCVVQTTSVGYTANAGYDSVTGLGSIDAWQLITCWTGTCAPSSTPPPAITGLTDAAAFQQLYSPGMIMAVFGSNLSPGVAGAASVPLPTSLAGVYATINGEVAPLYYVSSSQINLQIPWDIAPGQATLVVYNNGASTTQTLQIVGASPGIFADTTRTIVPSGSAARGQVASLYLTGQGPVSPSIATGAAPDTSIPLSRLPSSPSIAVTVGGVPASISCSNGCFAGIPYGLVGVTQINFQLDPNTPAGRQPVVVTAAGVSSPAAYINVQ